jgi:eukaryotic-like serine/threonine-protein kinase
VSMTNTQALMGSPLYMAPEQMRSTKNVDARADIWSMGVILYEMLGGRPPFDGETLPIVCARIMTESPPPLREVIPGVPPALDAIVMRCLEREPQQRFQDVAGLANALSSLGTFDARAVAGRIGRVVRGRSSSLAAGGIAAPSDPDVPLSAPAAKAVVQTRATFSKTGNASMGRNGPRARTVMIGSGAAFVGALVVIGMVVMRGGSKAETPSVAAHATLSAPAPAPVPATATATATPTATPTATATATATATPKSKSSAPRPPPAAKPASLPKPASTSAFGGRD